MLNIETDSEPLRRRRTKRNPSEVLIALAKDGYTDASGWLFPKWWEVICADDEFLLIVGRFFYDKHVRYTKLPPAPEEKEAAEAVNRARAAQLARKIVAHITLAFVMPNGKQLGDCTFSYVGKQGAFFTRVACAGGPNQIVHTVLTEKNLQEVLAGDA
jgi:hypothetical protein